MKTFRFNDAKSLPTPQLLTFDDICQREGVYRLSGEDSSDYDCFIVLRHEAMKQTVVLFHGRYGLEIADAVWRSEHHKYVRLDNAHLLLEVRR